MRRRGVERLDQPVQVREAVPVVDDDVDEGKRRRRPRRVEDLVGLVAVWRAGRVGGGARGEAALTADDVRGIVDLEPSERP